MALANKNHFDGKIAEDFRDSEPSWPSDKKPAANAPNIVMVVLDDVGYAQLGCYGSDIATPNIDKLAAQGTRLSHFNTTGICSATRSCLLTGRNHHSNHMGAVAELATGFPGYDFRMPKENGTIAEVLADNGYATFAIGKWHLTPAEEQQLGATRKRWPLGRGFERFYGFHGSDTSQYHPDLCYDNHQVQPGKTPAEGYHLSEDLAEKSIEFIRDLHNAAPGKPFFHYFSLGAMHTPLHAPKEYIDKYAGQFDLGWDEWRDQVYKRQLETGVLPEGTELTPRPDWIPAWDTLTEVEKRVSSKLMEVYAGFLEHTDAQIGRVIDELERLGKLDNTIIIVVSDNGASSEGGVNGHLNNTCYVNGIHESSESVDEQLDSLGQVETNPHYPYGWAWAGNTPFRRWKQEVHAGGVADPCVVHWPAGLGTQPQFRRQYAHAIDLMPTLLDLIGIEPPKKVEGVEQAPVQGVSYKPCLEDQSAPSPHTLQYYEIRGCRALYEDGWKVVTYHPRIGLSWDGSDPHRPYSEDHWELYNIKEDFSEMHDLSEQYPEKVAELVEKWFEEAHKHNVFPLDNRGVARLATRKSSAYEAVSGHVFYPSQGTIREHATISFKNRSHAFIADLDVPETGLSEGVLLSQGSGYGGWAFFVIDGKPAYVHNYAMKDEYTVISDVCLTPGHSQVICRFDKTGDNSGRVSLIINGECVAQGDVERTIPNIYNGGELSIGWNSTYAVSSLYRDRGHFPFNGEIRQIKVEVEASGSKEEEQAALEKVALAIQ